MWQTGKMYPKMLSFKQHDRLLCNTVSADARDIHGNKKHWFFSILFFCFPFLSTHLHISCDVLFVGRFVNKIIIRIKKNAYVSCFVAFCFIWVMINFTRIFQGYSYTIARMLLQRPWSWAWHKSIWRHQMETFAALLTICAGNSPVTGEFP